MNVIWLIIIFLAIIFVLPLLIYAGIHSKKVAREFCSHCIYAGWEGKTSPCYRCMEADHFERKV